MSYQALARKYRPQSFRDIIGQESVVRTLQNAIDQNRIHHAYLFSGVRGVGKTTSARILAKALNCTAGPTIEPDNSCTICREVTEGIDMDVREIDAATYTGVDNIRELREVTQFQPARDRYRIFIIDEAHMLSAGAWNALLKILEEPPAHVVFMFATTEINKVPSTILSRVQKFMLRKITLDELIGRLQQICESEGIEAERAALEIVARRGEGSVRDSLSLLDQVIAFSGKSIAAVDVATVLGLSEASFFARVVGLIADGNHAAILEALQEAADSGRDFKMLYRDLLMFVRSLLLVAGGANTAMLGAAPEDLAMIKASAEQFSYSELLRIANLLLKDDETVNRAEHQRLAVEIALLKAATFPRLRSVEQLIANGGAGSASTPSAEPRRAAAAPTRSADRVSEPARARVSAPDREDEQPARMPPPVAEPERERPRAAAPAANLGSFIDRVRKARPLLGNYLAEAASVEKDGNRIRFTFTDSFHVESLADAKAALEEVATAVFGEPTSVEIGLESKQQQSKQQQAAATERNDDRPSSLREDPVVKAFQKHLGGEIVESRKR